jgi:hypothetical protein
MNKFKAWFTVAVMATMLAMLAACGNSGGSSGGTPAPLVPGGGGTLPPGSKVSFYAQNNMMQYYYPNTPALYQVNSEYRNLLKLGMGVCDRQQSSGGLAACEAWVQGFHDIVLVFDGGTLGNSGMNNARLMFRSYPYVNCINPFYCTWYGYSLPSFSQFFTSILTGWPSYNISAVFNPLVLQGSPWPWNNSQGFKLQMNAPAGSLSFNNQGAFPAFEFEVANGKLEDPQFDFVVKFQGTVVSSGTMRRCNTQNCGIQGLQ